MSPARYCPPPHIYFKIDFFGHLGMELLEIRQRMTPCVPTSTLLTCRLDNYNKVLPLYHRMFTQRYQWHTSHTATVKTYVQSWECILLIPITPYLESLDYTIYTPSEVYENVFVPVSLITVLPIFNICLLKCQGWSWGIQPICSG